MAEVQLVAMVVVVEAELVKLVLTEDQTLEVMVVMVYPATFPVPLYTMPEAEAEAGMALLQERAGMAVVEQVFRSAHKHLPLEQMGLVVEVEAEEDTTRPGLAQLVDQV
jgi:hypothetical protein